MTIDTVFAATLGKVICVSCYQHLCFVLYKPKDNISPVHSLHFMVSYCIIISPRTLYGIQHYMYTCNISEITWGHGLTIEKSKRMPMNPLIIWCGDEQKTNKGCQVHDAGEMIYNYNTIRTDNVCWNTSANHRGRWYIDSVTFYFSSLSANLE